jgi:autotransporter-associated beta strand protein
VKALSFLLAIASLTHAIDLPIEVDPATPLTGTYAVEWNTTGSLENWTTNQISSANVAGGTLSGTSNGTLPRIIRSNFSGPDLDLGFNDYLELRIQVSSSHTGDIKISYGTTSTTGFNATRVLAIPDALIPSDGAFHTYRIDVGPEPWWRANLRDLRIEPTTTSGQRFAIDYLRVGDLPGDAYLPQYGWNSDNELSSKHFRFLWSSARAAQGVNLTTARGALRNAEEAWQVYVKIMGYREPAESTYSPDGNKYKVNFLCIYDGYYMSSTWDGFAYMNIDPSGLQTNPPTWIIPHELMHVFQHHNNNGNYSGQWETHANYARERWLQHYQVFYPNRSNIEALGVRDGHFMISSGRNYYLTWPFLYYIDDNPDNLPDLSDGMVKRLWQEGQSGEFWPATLDRLTPTTSLKDISGYYARRCATWDFSNQVAMTTELNLQDPTRNARHLFTELLPRADAPGWWRVPAHKAPAQGAYAMHELIPAGSGAGRVVTVNLQGLIDSARGADWRASLIAVSDTGVERYTPLWSNGSNSITLAANENKLYLSVAGTPDWYANGGFNEATEPFRSHPSRSRFHYQIQVTGATPRERDNGSTAGLTQHSNGGGWKSVSVPSSVFIGPNARVTGGSVSGSARIEDHAVVSGGIVNRNAVVSGHAWVRGGTVTDNTRVRDWAIVDNGTISGNCRIIEHATVEGNMQDNAVAKGSSWHQAGGTLSGNAIVDGDYMGNKSISGGITFGHQPFVGIPDNFTTATPTSHYASYHFNNAHDSRALDRFGVTDAFTVGSPSWISTDWKRMGFLTFNGNNQYLVLDRSVADMSAFTFAAWVKPTGNSNNQALLWMGASPTQRLSLTHSDASGQLKFSMIINGSEQTLTTTALPRGVWSHVAVTLDGTNGQLFVNGNVAATAAMTLTPEQLLASNTTAGMQQNYIGRAESSEMSMFEGAIDDVQFYSSALTAAQLAAVTIPLASDILLSDNFDSGSYGASGFNSTLSVDQKGLFAPVSYSVTGHNADYKIQHGNGGQMLMAAWFGGESLDLRAGLNLNFADAVNSLNQPLKIQFDLKITDSQDQSNWSSIAVGNSQNAFVNNNSNKFSSLFRHNGGTQQFSSGNDISHGITWNANGSAIAVILSDTAGTGSPFNDKGSVVKFYVNNALVATYPISQLTPQDGYISFQGFGVFANIDNLNISVESRPSYAVSYQATNSTGGLVPIDQTSPYTLGSTVTILGNSGALTRTGFTFSHWNTQADGNGTSYYPGDAFSINSPMILHAQWVPGPDFFWNNSSSTNIWSASERNWNGNAWINSSANRAFFYSVGGSLTLDKGLTCGDIVVGSTAENFPLIALAGGTLNATQITIQGNASNYGAYAGNPSLTVNSSLAFSGDTKVGRANLVVTGGTFSTNRIISASDSADWARLMIQGGTVIATNGIDGSANTNATFQLELQGGILETSSLRVANRDINQPGPDSNNDANLIWNGGTLKAIGADNENFITLYGDGSNASNPSQASYVESGGAIIDTNGRNIGMNIKLLGGSGNGGLTKNGTGRLTLTAVNSYSGATIVNSGILRLGNGTQSTNLADSSDLIVASGAMLHLNYLGTDIVQALRVGGLARPPGIYSSANSDFIQGTGTLTVLSGPVSDYAAWESMVGIQGGLSGDDDQDGLSNFAEYAFGLQPHSSASHQAITQALSLDSGKFSYHRRKISLTGMTYHVETSNNLHDWSIDSNATQVATPISGSDLELVEVTVHHQRLSSQRLFIRITTAIP